MAVVSVLARIFQLLCLVRMSRSASLQPIRVAPESKSSVETALREGETLTQFIENAVCHEAEFRAEQNAAVVRAKKTLRQAECSANWPAMRRTKVGLPRFRDALSSGMEILAFAPHTGRSWN